MTTYWFVHYGIFITDPVTKAKVGNGEGCHVVSVDSNFFPVNAVSKTLLEKVRSEEIIPQNHLLRGELQLVIRNFFQVLFRSGCELLQCTKVSSKIKRGFLSHMQNS